MSTKLNDLCNEYGIQQKHPAYLINYFADQAWGELAAKVGLPKGTTQIQMARAMENPDEALAEKLLAVATELGLMREGMVAGAERLGLRRYYDGLALNRLEEKLLLPKTRIENTALGFAKLEEAWKAIEATLE